MPFWFISFQIPPFLVPDVLSLALFSFGPDVWVNVAEVCVTYINKLHDFLLKRQRHYECILISHSLCRLLNLNVKFNVCFIAFLFSFFLTFCKAHWITSMFEKWQTQMFNFYFQSEGIQSTITVWTQSYVQQSLFAINFV